MGLVKVSEIALCTCAKKDPRRVWRLQTGKLYHQQGLARFISGELTSDAED